MAKSFPSQSLDHIKLYPLVQRAISFAFSFQLVNILYTYALASANIVYSKIVARFPVATLILQQADTRFDSVVLSTVDVAVDKGDVLIKQGDAVFQEYRKKGLEYAQTYKEVGDEYRKKAEDIAADYRKKGEDTISVYLKPVNEYASTTVDKVLPKAKDVGETAPSEATSELVKSIEIVNDTLNRSRHLISAKSNEISNSVISIYNQQFDAVETDNYFTKVASASVNTGVTLLKSVNLEYVQPLKESSQIYASEAAAPIKEKVQQVSETVAATSNRVAEKLGDAPVLTASA